MTGPCLIDFLELVTADVESVKLGALEAGPFEEFIVRDIEPLEVRETVICGEDRHVLDLVIGKIKSRQSC